MRVSFVLVSETTPEFLNMSKLLLYSFRKNAGLYKDSDFTMITIGNSIDDNEIRELKNNFNPLNVVTMPRLGGVPYNNKFNYLYAVDPESYDILIYLDCDIAILGPLDEITDNIDLEREFLKAFPIASPGSRSVDNYENLILQYCGITVNALTRLKNKDFLPGYPLFNSGVIVINKKAVLKIRDDILKISNQLYRNKLESTIAGGSFINLIFHKIREYFGGNNTNYELWVTEQLVLALAMIKNDIGYSTLERRFNCFQFEESLPVILHYLYFKKEIDTKNLFSGDWFKGNLNNNHPAKSALANLVNSYNNKYGIKE